MVAYLSTAFCIERGGVQDNRTRLSCFEFGNGNTFQIQGHHFGVGCQRFVPDKRITCPCVLQGLVHLEFASGTGLVFLLVHRGVEASFVDSHATLAAHIVGQIERKAIGVVQFEGHITREFFAFAFGGFCTRGVAIAQGFIQDLHTNF